jgi:hypothetical protein
MKLEIYDPAMCCSSGLCGPEVDHALLKINEALLILQKQGVEVTRYNLAQTPLDFIANKTVAELLQNKGNKILPITLVNRGLFKTGSYPVYEDLCRALDIEPVAMES